jgi:hypothetical protein
MGKSAYECLLDIFENEELPRITFDIICSVWDGWQFRRILKYRKSKKISKFILV